MKLAPDLKDLETALGALQNIIVTDEERDAILRLRAFIKGAFKEGIPKKVVQLTPIRLTTVPNDDWEKPRDYIQFNALCEDGTMWARTATSEGAGEWEQIPFIMTKP